MPKQPRQLNFQVIMDVIKALKIDVPVMNYEQDENGAITIYLYGGGVKHWPPAGSIEAQPRIDPPPPVLQRTGPPETSEAQPRIDPPPPVLERARPPVTRSQLAAEKKKSQRSKRSQP